MAAHEFLTLPNDASSDLQPLAAAMNRELKHRGYSVTIEPADINLPATPTFKAKRGHETLFVLVRSAISKPEIQKWVRFAQICTTDTRIAVCTSNGSVAHRKMSDIESGVGLFCENGGAFHVVLATRDLAFTALPPSRSSLRPKVRKLLGEALDKYEQGDWRDGFELACVTLENQCRAYLIKNRKQRLGRVSYKDGSKTKTPTERQINGMTLGALKHVLCNMLMPTPTDSHLCAALGTLNKDRIGKVHHPMKASTERRLRTRVGNHLYLISNALTLIAYP